MRTGTTTAPTTRTDRPRSLTAGLRQAVDDIACTPRLLVATAYNGTLAEIGDHPGRARPLPEAVRPLRALARMNATSTAVISGHALRDLAALSRLPEEVRLAGSYGWESDVDVASRLGDEAKTLLARLVAELRSLTDAVPGALLEVKPASVGIHLGATDQHRAEWVLHRVRSGPAHLRGVHLSEGRHAIELSVVALDKGTALESLRGADDATATVYLGDDVADETAFGRLGPEDLGIRVGPGNTAARHRIGAITDVPAVLNALLRTRRIWLRDHR